MDSEKLNFDQIFITGTDTGVGKSVISAILTYGLKASYWKPIQSGNDPMTDSEWVKMVTELPSSHFLPEAYYLKAPLSPHYSARLEGTSIDLSNCIFHSQSPTIIEGAGGILTPLNDEGILMIDLIKQLDIPVIVVARTSLGTINHTLMTLSILNQYGIDVIGVVMNGCKNPSNSEAVAHFGKVPILAEIPSLKNFSKQTLNAQFKKFSFQAKERELASV